MGKLDTFEIKLTSPGPVLSGSSIKGQVQLRIKKELDVARLMIYLFGGGQVEFQDGPANTRQGASRAVYEDRESYLRMSQMPYSKSQGQRLNRNELHKFDFEFHLPTDIPSSFMTVVYYKLTAFLDCAGKSHDTELPIVIINDLDLNRYSGRLRLLEPIDSWSPVRGRVDTGLVSARMVVHKRGFAIGETISMQFELYNNSKVKLESIHACLVQKGILKAYGAGGIQLKRVQRLLVRNVSLGKLRNGDRLLVDEAKLQVPWVVTSEIEKCCRLIEIEYYLQLTTRTPMLSGLTGSSMTQIVCIGPDYKRTEMVNVLVEEQIAIGMRPLRDGSEGFQAAAAAAQSMPSAPLSPEFGDLTMFTMVPSAPPSYDEALTHEKVPADQAMPNGSPSRDES